MSKFSYQEAVGTFMLTAPMTQSNIACGIRDVARFCESAGLAHEKTVLKVTQYLLHAKEWELAYDGQGCGLGFWSLPG